MQVSERIIRPQRQKVLPQLRVPVRETKVQRCVTLGVGSLRTRTRPRSEHDIP